MLFFWKTFPNKLPACKLHCIVCFSPGNLTEDACNPVQQDNSCTQNHQNRKGRETSFLKACMCATLFQLPHNQILSYWSSKDFGKDWVPSGRAGCLTINMLQRCLLSWYICSSLLLWEVQVLHFLFTQLILTEHLLYVRLSPRHEGCNCEQERQSFCFLWACQGSGASSETEMALQHCPNWVKPPLTHAKIPTRIDWGPKWQLINLYSKTPAKKIGPSSSLGSCPFPVAKSNGKPNNNWRCWRFWGQGHGDSLNDMSVSYYHENTTWFTLCHSKELTLDSMVGHRQYLPPCNPLVNALWLTTPAFSPAMFVLLIKLQLSVTGQNHCVYMCAWGNYICVLYCSEGSLLGQDLAFAEGATIITGQMRKRRNQVSQVVCLRHRPRSYVFMEMGGEFHMDII